MMGEKTRFGDHHVVLKEPEVSCIFQFFSENIAGINDTRNVKDLGGTIRSYVPNFLFAETNVPDAFVGK